MWNRLFLIAGIFYLIPAGIFIVLSTFIPGLQNSYTYSTLYGFFGMVFYGGGLFYISQFSSKEPPPNKLITLLFVLANMGTTLSFIGPPLAYNFVSSVGSYLFFLSGIIFIFILLLARRQERKETKSLSEPLPIRIFLTLSPIYLLAGALFMGEGERLSEHHIIAAGRHFYLLGFIMGMIFGMASHLTARFLEERGGGVGEVWEILILSQIGFLGIPIGIFTDMYHLSALCGILLFIGTSHFAIRFLIRVKGWLSDSFAFMFVTLGLISVMVGELLGIYIAFTKRVDLVLYHFNLNLSFVTFMIFGIGFRFFPYIFGKEVRSSALYSLSFLGSIVGIYGFLALNALEPGRHSPIFNVIQFLGFISFVAWVLRRDSL